jgi:hypothetical protein
VAGELLDAASVLDGGPGDDIVYPDANDSYANCERLGA